jgi:hypothetical protein
VSIGQVRWHQRKEAITSIIPSSITELNTDILYRASTLYDLATEVFEMSFYVGWVEDKLLSLFARLHRKYGVDISNGRA